MSILCGGVGVFDDRTCGNQSFQTYNPAGQNARDEQTNTRIELGAKHDDRNTAAGF